MAEITASMVKELREKSGAGMMDCKKALTEAEGDFDKAMALLRERGEAIAVKRSGRSAKEGLIEGRVSADGKQGALIELNCESDFVARNDDFKALAAKLAEHALSSPAGGDLNETQLDGTSVGELVKGSVGKIGENLVLSRSAKLESKDGVVISYIHPPGKIGVLVDLSTASADAASNADFQQFGRGLAMHIAALNPLCLSRDMVSQETLDAEREIQRNITLNEGKPEAIVDKIVEGRMGKYFGEVCLLEQPYAMEPEKKVEAVVKEAGSRFGGEIKLTNYVRFQLGENASDAPAED